MWGGCESLCTDDVDWEVGVEGFEKEGLVEKKRKVYRGGGGESWPVENGQSHIQKKWWVDASSSGGEKGRSKPLLGKHKGRKDRVVKKRKFELRGRARKICLIDGWRGGKGEKRIVFFGWERGCRVVVSGGVSLCNYRPKLWKKGWWHLNATSGRVGGGIKKTCSVTCPAVYKLSNGTIRGGEKKKLFDHNVTSGMRDYACERHSSAGSGTVTDFLVLLEGGEVDRPRTRVPAAGKEG